MAAPAADGDGGAPRHDADLAAPQVGVSRAEIDSWDDEAKCSMRYAHNWLRTWRNAKHPFDHQDLTTSGEFNWMGYLKKHRHLDIIVPNNDCKVVRFAVGKYPAMDTNTGESRVDFAVCRDDGKVVRLHPSSNQEAKPVIRDHDADHRFMVIRGYHEISAQGTAQADDQAADGKGKGKGGKGEDQDGQAAGGKGKGGKGRAMDLHFESISQADVLHVRRVIEWLDDRARLWPGTKFAADITYHGETLAPRDMGLAWPLFFAGFPDLLHPLIHQVSRIWVAWLGEPHNKPCMWMRLHDNRQFVIDLGDGKKNKPTFSEELVGSIDWNQ